MYLTNLNSLNTKRYFPIQKVHQVPKGKEAKIIELITRIEALQMKIKSLEKAKSAKAKAAAAVLKVLLQDIKKALVQLRMKNE